MPDLFTIYRKLLAHYGPRHWWPADSPFEMAVGAILTQNTNWQNVEKAISNLRAADALDVASMAELDAPRLEELIYPSGFFRQKSTRLKLLCRHLLDQHSGRLENLLAQPLEQARPELLSLNGIGPETADSILLYAGAHPSFVIDAYTGRIFSRLGILHGKEKYAEVREFFMTLLPPESDLFNEYHALIVAHAKAHCRTKPLCIACPLAEDCRYLSDLQG